MFHHGLVRSLVLNAALTAIAPLARAQSGPIEHLSQDRYVEAYGFDFVGPDPFTVKETVAAPDFGPFDVLVKIGQVPGSAQQTSTLGDAKIAATGYGWGMHYLQSWNTYGNSSFSVTFNILSPVKYHLSGVVSVGDSSLAEVSLGGIGVNWSAVADPWLAPVVVFDEVGTLPMGAYTLSAVGSGGGDPGGTGKFTFTFEVVEICPPDCDASGTLTIDDFICFQTYFVLGDALADCDKNGQLAIDDFICFQTFFVLGC